MCLELDESVTSSPAWSTHLPNYDFGPTLILIFPIGAWGSQKLCVPRRGPIVGAPGCGWAILCIWEANHTDTHTLPRTK